MKLLSDLLNVFFPVVCAICEEPLLEQEEIICIDCRHDLPLTGFSSESNNLVEKAFYGRIPLRAATALFYYADKSNIQTLIHQLKYKNQQQIGDFIGNWLSQEMIFSQRFKNIDYIIPVPLHQNKLKLRGYNQVTKFGQSLSKSLKIPYIDNLLLRIAATKTQTKKNRFERWTNVQEIFYLKNFQILENKHILLIDDIITTGATLEACYIALKNVKNLTISIACMAYTK